MSQSLPWLRELAAAIERRDVAHQLRTLKATHPENAQAMANELATQLNPPEAPPLSPFKQLVQRARQNAAA